VHARLVLRGWLSTIVAAAGHQKQREDCDLPTGTIYVDHVTGF
jgi:hypothetical protein